MGKEDKESELGDALVRAIKTTMRGALIVDGVISDTSKAETSFVCDVKIGDSIYHNVPLKILIGKQASFIEIPENDSNCLLCFRDGNTGRPQIFACDKVLKILVNCNEFKVDSDNIVFNGGKLGGLVKAKELKTQSEKDKKILDAILQIINGAPINEPGNGAPSALQTALKGILTSLQSGTWDNLENDKITQ